MATQLSQFQIRSQTESLQNKSINIMQRLQSIVVSRTVVAGNTQASQENDRLITELKAVEEQIKTLISSFENSIKKAKEDVLKIRQSIPKLGINMSNGQVAGRLELQKMSFNKEEEIKFLQAQIHLLKENIFFINFQKNNKYRHTYRVVERSPATSLITMQIDGLKPIEDIRLEALNGDIRKGFIAAEVKENGRVRIKNIEVDGSCRKQKIGTMLVKALESQFNQGTIFYIAMNTNEAPEFWKKNGYIKVSHNGKLEDYKKI